MRVSVNTKQFTKEMNNIVEYSLGYLDGVKAGKSVFFKNLGLNVKEVLEKYIDSNARVSPEALHHIYEWSKVGSPDARLYDINYTVSNLGLSFMTNFKQSSIKLSVNLSLPIYLAKTPIKSMHSICKNLASGNF
jgi:hypothetical protein